MENQTLYYRTSRDPVKVGAVYRRVSDEYMDPLCFEPSSLIGIPNLMDAYRAGNVAVMNAPGNGVADDKGIYYFVPKMISYYLGEDAILKNAPTYLPYYEEDRKYTLDNIDKLVIKDVAEAGGYGVVFGENLTREQREDLKNTIIHAPRRFIAQEVIDFKDLPILEKGETVERKADLRAFVLSGEDVHQRTDPVLPEPGQLRGEFFAGRRLQGHMDSLSVSKLNRLYWLGRYYERLATTLGYLWDWYDVMIDLVRQCGACGKGCGGS